jgi:hypothetical protein
VNDDYYLFVHEMCDRDRFLIKPSPRRALVHVSLFFGLSCVRINVYQREHLGNNLCCAQLAREQEAERGVQKYLFFIFGIYNRSAQKGSKIKPVVPLCSVKLCSKIKVTGEDNLFCRGALS